MQASQRLLRIHTPLIHFVGRRTTSPAEPHQAQPHPASPPDVVSQFSALFRVKDSPVTAATTDLPGHTQVYGEFWHAPSRLWQPARSVPDDEAVAVMSGGASLR